MFQMARLTVRATLRRGTPGVDLIRLFLVKMILVIHYPPAYPDELPELTLSYDDPNMNEDDVEKLTADLSKVVGVFWLFMLEVQDETLLVGNRKPWDGHDLYPGDTLTRTDQCVDTGKTRAAEEIRGRKGSASVGGMYFDLTIFKYGLNGKR